MLNSLVIKAQAKEREDKPTEVLDEYLICGFGLLQVIISETDFKFTVTDPKRAFENELGTVYVLTPQQKEIVDKFIGFSVKKHNSFSLTSLSIKFIVISKQIKRFIKDFSDNFSEIVSIITKSINRIITLPTKRMRINSLMPLLLS